eukprot:2500947-Prymnesium_polylepis.1
MAPLPQRAPQTDHRRSICVRRKHAVAAPSCIPRRAPAVANHVPRALAGRSFFRHLAAAVSDIVFAHTPPHARARARAPQARLPCEEQLSCVNGLRGPEDAAHEHGNACLNTSITQRGAPEPTTSSTTLSIEPELGETRLMTRSRL